MSTDYNPYMLDDNHAHDMQHSKFELGQGKLRDMQKSIAEKRKRTEAMLKELGFDVVKRDPDHYEKAILLRQEYVDHKEEYDHFIEECLKISSPEIFLEALNRYISKS